MLIPHQPTAGTVYRCLFCNATSEKHPVFCSICVQKRKSAFWDNYFARSLFSVSIDIMFMGILLALKTLAFILVTFFFLWNLIKMAYDSLKEKSNILKMYY